MVHPVLLVFWKVAHHLPKSVTMTRMGSGGKTTALHWLLLWVRVGSPLYSVGYTLTDLPVIESILYVVHFLPT